MSKKGASTETQVSAKLLLCNPFLSLCQTSREQDFQPCSAITVKLLKVLLQRHQMPPLFRQKPFL